MPVHPRLPKSSRWRHEAAVNFRELLAARGLDHLTASSAAAAPFPPMLIPAPAAAAAPAAVLPRPASSSDPLGWLALGGALGAAAAGYGAWRLRSRIERLISR